MADIFIFSGQSNMQGQSELLLSTGPIEGAYEYRWLTDSLVPLCDPVGEDIRYDKTAGVPFGGGNLSEWLGAHALGSACYGHSTLVPTFCESYIRQTHAEVVAIHAAKGSTCIGDWLPGTANFDVLCVKAAAGIARAKASGDVGRIFFIWLQGESDAIAGKTKAYYKEKIRLLSVALREKIGAEKFCIIRVGRFTNDGRDLEIIEAQDEICREDDGFLMLTQIATELNGQPEFMNPQVRGHYSAKGLQALGTAAGETLGKYACMRPDL